jgi:hypothetical protein
MIREHKKHKFPAFAELDVKPDISLISDFMYENYDKWEDNITAHKGLAVASNNIANETYKCVEHFHLTVPKHEDNTELHASDYSLKDKLKRDVSYTMDEHNWNTPTCFYDGTELQSHLNGLFKSNIIRARYSRMQPGGIVPPHIDYNTTYAVRWIMPINGNEGVVDKFWYKGEELELEMENGKMYFLNIGYRHAVYHNGTKTRHYLMGSLASQEDILHLMKTDIS